MRKSKSQRGVFAVAAAWAAISVLGALSPTVQAKVLATGQELKDTCGKISAIDEVPGHFSVTLDGTGKSGSVTFEFWVLHPEWTANAHVCDKTSGQYYAYMLEAANRAMTDQTPYCVKFYKDLPGEVLFAGHPEDFDRWVEPNEGGTCG